MGAGSSDFDENGWTLAIKEVYHYSRNSLGNFLEILKLIYNFEHQRVKQQSEFMVC